MQYYADINEFNNIIGFYVDEIHGEAIPNTAIPITQEEWQLYSQDAGRFKYDGSSFREKTEEEITEELANLPILEVPKTDEQVRIEQLEAQLVQSEQMQAELLLQLAEKGVI